MNQKHNMKILWRLFCYFLKNPHIRFWQGLWNLRIVEGITNNKTGQVFILDKHHESSKITLMKMEE